MNAIDTFSNAIETVRATAPNIAIKVTPALGSMGYHITVSIEANARVAVSATALRDKDATQHLIGVLEYARRDLERQVKRGLGMK